MADVASLRANLPVPDNGAAASGGLDPVAVKAFRRLAEAWALGSDEAAALADVAPRTWARVRQGDWKGRLGQDQRLRLSALVGLYKGLHLYFSDELADTWVKRANAGPLFRGESPLAFMRAGGLPAIIATRAYVDAVRGGT